MIMDFRGAPSFSPAKSTVHTLHDVAMAAGCDAKRSVLAQSGDGPFFFSSHSM